mmetsp:Transcript_52711/g.136075  ORF Transcript_52711/g.136075 Transcript_52711/m.136075 type:complete len:240 (+) Transcript_52711:75-794(+)
MRLAACRVCSTNSTPRLPQSPVSFLCLLLGKPCLLLCPCLCLRHNGSVINLVDPLGSHHGGLGLGLFLFRNLIIARLFTLLEDNALRAISPVHHARHHEDSPNHSTDEDEKNRQQVLRLGLIQVLSLRHRECHAQCLCSLWGARIILLVRALQNLPGKLHDVHLVREGWRCARQGCGRGHRGRGCRAPSGHGAWQEGAGQSQQRSQCAERSCSQATAAATTWRLHPPPPCHGCHSWHGR